MGVLLLQFYFDLPPLLSMEDPIVLLYQISSNTWKFVFSIYCVSIKPERRILVLCRGPGTVLLNRRPHTGSFFICNGHLLQGGTFCDWVCLHLDYREWPSSQLLVRLTGDETKPASCWHHGVIPPHSCLQRYVGVQCLCYFWRTKSFTWYDMGELA